MFEFKFVWACIGAELKSSSNPRRLLLLLFANTFEFELLLGNVETGGATTFTNGGVFE
jgi:hypothetical protein